MFRRTILIYGSLIKIKKHGDKNSKQPGICGGVGAEVKLIPVLQQNLSLSKISATNQNLHKDVIPFIQPRNSAV